ncbi:MAG: HAD family hydrolase [Pseudomonadota bacterium]
MAGRFKGLLFDKDGTLYDFHGTWARWCVDLLDDLTKGDEAHMQRLADALRFDLPTERYHPDSPVIAGTPDEAVVAMLPHLPRWTATDLRAYVIEASNHAPLAEATPLVPLLTGLKDVGYVLGVSTNDAEEPASQQLVQSGVRDLFSFIAGYDSGYGAKPAPGMQQGFCTFTGLPEAETVMIGDSLHDLEAGRAAGMATVAVLTGPAPRAVLSPRAEVVLDSIADLPRWLATQT